MTARSAPILAFSSPSCNGLESAIRYSSGSYEVTHSAPSIELSPDESERAGSVSAEEEEGEEEGVLNAQVIRLFQSMAVCAMAGVDTCHAVRITIERRPLANSRVANLRKPEGEKKEGEEEVEEESRNAELKPLGNSLHVGFWLRRASLQFGLTYLAYCLGWLACSRCFQRKSSPVP